MKNKNINTLVKISFLGAISFVIMMFSFKLPIFPSFLEIDLSDIPALIGAFALGPVEGVIIELLKNILNGAITGSKTMWIGELANFLVGSAFVFTSGYIYKRHKSKKNAIFGMILGNIAMTIIAALFNYFILIPFYATAGGFGLQAIIDMAKAINPKVTDLKTLIIWSIVPFNILKGIVIAVITTPLYKGLSPVLHKNTDFSAKKEKYNEI